VANDLPSAKPGSLPHPLHLTSALQLRGFAGKTDPLSWATLPRDRLQSQSGHNLPNSFGGSREGLDRNREPGMRRKRFGAGAHRACDAPPPLAELPHYRSCERLPTRMDVAYQYLHRLRNHRRSAVLAREMESGWSVYMSPLSISGSSEPVWTEDSACKRISYISLCSSRASSAQVILPTFETLNRQTSRSAAKTRFGFSSV
jgi:hypothetical protein